MVVATVVIPLATSEARILKGPPPPWHSMEGNGGRGRGARGCGRIGRVLRSSE